MCSCPKFYKEYVCKHVIGILIRLKIILCPVKAKNVPIGYTRGVGRPKKAKYALEFQQDYFDDLINDKSDEEDANIGENDESTICSASNPRHADVSVEDEDGTEDDADEIVVVQPILPIATQKKRGRPPGSKNKTNPRANR